jgi:hypothetical protein
MIRKTALTNCSVEDRLACNGRLKALLVTDDYIKIKQLITNNKK